MDTHDHQHLYLKSRSSFYQALAYTTLFFSLMAGSVYVWHEGYWYLSVICWLVQAHIGHVTLIAFHESSHYTLHPRRDLNELFGILIGCFSLTPLSAYRLAHNQHHISLAKPHDPELWPYCNPATPRGLRILATVGELVFGFFYTPLLFLRAVVVADRVQAATRRRIVAEYALIGVVWGGIVALTAYFAAWEWLLVGLLIPSMIAGNFQSLRKFIEHMGLLGDEVSTTTRTVIDTSAFGRLLSHTMLHIDYHGPHHRYAKIPFHHLPEATSVLCVQQNEPNVFPSYFAALWAMAKTIHNPRVGVQWTETRGPVTRGDALAAPGQPVLGTT